MENAVYCVLMMKGCDKKLVIHEPRRVTPGWDYICFTDNPRLKSKVWQFRKLSSTSLGPRKDSRRPKILNDEYLPEYDISIYVDSRFKVRINLDKFTRKYLKDYDIAMMHSPKRQCVYAEAKLCRRLRLDSKRVQKQVARYREEGVPERVGLTRCGLIVRKHHVDSQIKFMEEWWSEYENESDRDTISFAYVFWKHRENQLNINRLPTQEVYKRFR